MVSHWSWIAFLSVVLCAGSALAANTPPVARGIANVTANEDGPPVTINLFTAFDDSETPDRQLRFSVASNTNPTLVATSVNALTGQLVLTLRLNQSGVAQLLVRCTDTGGQSAQSSFRVTVNPVPDAPTLGPIPVQQAKVGLVFTLTVKGQDGDLPNDVLRYTLDAASLARGTTIATSNGSGSIRWAPPRGSEGQTFPVTVTVLDRNNQSASQTFQIQVQQTTVITNPPPPPPPPLPLVAVNDRTSIAVGQSVNLTNLIRANDQTNGRATRIVQIRFPFYVNPYEILQ
ncbi:MAG TPA: putative Ig domain-containing protein, partial [Planctomycetaceae bacterium]|nr:putative Ig domain-containing protein [Planctomycetaceae bacterium]